MIAPTTRLCLLALVPMVPTAALFVAPTAWPAVVVADVLVLAVALADRTTLPGRSGLRVRRMMQPIALRANCVIRVAIARPAASSLAALMRLPVDSCCIALLSERLLT